MSDETLRAAERGARASTDPAEHARALLARRRTEPVCRACDGTGLQSDPDGLRPGRDSVRCVMCVGTGQPFWARVALGVEHDLLEWIAL